MLLLCLQILNNQPVTAFYLKSFLVAKSLCVGTKTTQKGLLQNPSSRYLDSLGFRES